MLAKRVSLQPCEIEKKTKKKKPTNRTTQQSSALDEAAQGGQPRLHLWRRTKDLSFGTPSLCQALPLVLTAFVRALQRHAQHVGAAAPPDDAGTPASFILGYKP